MTLGRVLMESASSIVPLWLFQSIVPAMCFGFVLTMAYGPGLAALGHASVLGAAWRSLCIWAGHPTAALVAFAGLAATIGWWSFPWWKVVRHYETMTFVRWGGLVFGTVLLAAWAMAVQRDAIGDAATATPPDVH